MVNAATVLSEIELALTGVEEVLPGILGTIGIFDPRAAALAKFLPLFEIAIKGVDVVKNATGEQNNIVAQAAVINHLTPGQPGAPALN